MRRPYQRRKAGFTLLEVVVAVVVILLVGAAVAGILIRQVNRAKAGATAYDVISIRTAVASAMARGDLVDANHDGNYLDDLLKKGYLNKAPSVIPGASYQVLKATKSNGTELYYLEIECTNEECVKTLKALDEEIDGGDGPDNGTVQWVETG